MVNSCFGLVVVLFWLFSLCGVLSFMLSMLFEDIVWLLWFLVVVVVVV